ncbi:hypothetical protein C8R44DRAFT_985279 [Mycena epipterygia]|nr:hypothetical protein C8R44DRAFT_985279 [Mycena epipterygia]
MFTTVLQLLALTAVAPQFVAASPALLTVVAPFGGDDPTTLTAAVLGVDSLGRTTYALAQNEMQGDSTLADITATLVEGSDYLSYAFSHTSAGETIVIGPVDCALTAGNAVCSDLDDSGKPETATIPLPSMGSWVIDVVSTAGATPTASPSKSTPSAAPSGSAPTSSPTSKPNSAHKVSVSLFGALMGVLMISQLV